MEKDRKIDKKFITKHFHKKKMNLFNYYNMGLYFKKIMEY
jgi:hypothetical protein